jgi:hypothetical protein
MSKDFAAILNAMAAVPQQDINPETGAVRRLGGTIISKEEAQKPVAEIGPSGLEGLEDLLGESESKQIPDGPTGIVDQVQNTQNAYLRVMNPAHQEEEIQESKTPLPVASEPEIIKVEELPNEHEIMESYVSMIQDNLY